MKTSLYKGGISEHYFKIKHAAGGGDRKRVKDHCTLNTTDISISYS